MKWERGGVEHEKKRGRKAVEKKRDRKAGIINV